MIDLLLELPGHLRKRLTDALAAGTLGPPYSPISVESCLGAGGDEVAAAANTLQTLDGEGVTPKAVLLAMKAVQKAMEEVTMPELVWSGPEVSGLHARDTRRVYEELIAAAQRSIVASTYAYFDGPKAFKVLSERMDATPDLKVTLLLNIQRKWGDTTSEENLVAAFSEKFWGKDWPGHRKPSVFYFPQSLRLEGETASLHAKGVVVDDDTVFVTSANFTEAALDRNIEVGILSRDRTLAASLAKHFRVLIERELLTPLPMA